MAKNVYMTKAPQWASGFMDLDGGHELEDVVKKHPKVSFEVGEWNLTLKGDTWDEILRAVSEIDDVSFDCSIEYKNKDEAGLSYTIGFY